MYVQSDESSKYRCVQEIFGEERVGLRTGDVSVNPGAPVMIMTTEILRNISYRTLLEGDPLSSFAPNLGDVALTVLDEVHYLGNPDRGSVWEEIIINCPPHMKLLAMSATVANPAEIGEWIQNVHGACETVQTSFRPVPLKWWFAWGQPNARSESSGVNGSGRNGSGAGGGDDGDGGGRQRQGRNGRDSSKGARVQVSYFHLVFVSDQWERPTKKGNNPNRTTNCDLGQSNNHLKGTTAPACIPSRLFYLNRAMIASDLINYSVFTSFHCSVWIEWCLCTTRGGDKCWVVVQVEELLENRKTRDGKVKLNAVLDRSLKSAKQLRAKTAVLQRKMLRGSSKKAGYDALQQMQSKLAKIEQVCPQLHTSCYVAFSIAVHVLQSTEWLRRCTAQAIAAWF